MPAMYVEKSIVINKSAEDVYAAVVDFGTWTTWSPWLCAENEPNSVTQITNPADQLGAIYSWDGTNVGAGEIEHAELKPAECIEEKLRFTRPFKSKSDVTFLFQPVAEGTKVTWIMNGSLPWFLFFLKGMMQNMIGMDYDRGLKMLKEFVETGAVASQTYTHADLSTQQQRYIIGVRRNDHFDQLSDGMEACFCTASQRLEDAGLISSSIGTASAYHHVDMKAQQFDYTSGFLFDELPENVPVGLDVAVLNAGKYFQVDHTGAYEHLGNSWMTAYQVTRNRKMKVRKSPSYEIYANSPEEVSREELLTIIYLPVK